MKFHKERSSRFFEAPVAEYDDKEIMQFLETAKGSAVSFLSQVGVVATDDFFNMSYTLKKEKASKNNHEYDTSDSESDDEVCDKTSVERFIGNDCEAIKTFCGEYVDQCNSDEENDGRYFYSTNDENKKIKIRKEAFIHLFSDPERVSKDRDRRFRTQNIMKIVETMVTTTQTLEKLHEFDFITLHQFTGVARVLAFRFAKKKTKKASRVKCTVVKLKEQNIEMSLEYFKITAEGELISAPVKDIDDQLFITVNQYKSHVPIIIEKGRKFINCEIGDLFSNKETDLDKLFLGGFPALKRIEPDITLLSKGKKRKSNIMAEELHDSTRKTKLAKSETSQSKNGTDKKKPKQGKQQKKMAKKNSKKSTNTNNASLPSVVVPTAFSHKYKIIPPNKLKK